MLGAPSSRAQSPDANAAAFLEMQTKADQAYGAGAWVEAASLYAALVKLNPTNGKLWIRLARAQAHLGQYLAAVPNFEEAMRLGVLDAPRGRYTLAQAYAAAGRPDQALEQLRLAIAAGYRYRDDIAADAAFKTLAADRRFQALVTPACLGTTRTAGWTCDLDILLGEIARVHYRYRDRPPPKSVTDLAAAFRRNLPHMTDAEAILTLQRMVAQLGDGHSLVYPVGMTRGVIHVLPLRLYWFSDGLFVLAGGADPSLAGAKVVAIGGVPPEALLARLGPYMSHDNDSELKWVSPGYIKLAELLKLVGVPMNGDGFDVEILDRAGVARTVTIEPIPKPPGEDDFDITLPPSAASGQSLAFSHIDKSYWFQRLPGGVVYVQFNHVRNDDDESLAKFAGRLRADLKAAPARGLILDLRRNNGGEATLTPDLLRTLVWFETEHGPRSLVALIGRNTFSAAQNFSSYLNIMTEATFVGEPTGSRPVHIGDEAPFKLPYSGAVGQLAPGLHADALYQDDRVWIAPDVPAPLSAADYYAGRDPGLTAALAVLDTTRPAAALNSTR